LIYQEKKILNSDRHSDESPPPTRHLGFSKISVTLFPVGQFE
jgi:hypothetical protein